MTGRQVEGECVKCNYPMTVKQATYACAACHPAYCLAKGWPSCPGTACHQAYERAMHRRQELSQSWNLSRQVLSQPWVVPPGPPVPPPADAAATAPASEPELSEATEVTRGAPDDDDSSWDSGEFYEMFGVLIRNELIGFLE